MIFPVEIGDRLVGWQGRYVDETVVWDEERGQLVEIPKMLSSKGIPTAQTVMFSNRITSDYVVVCEGPIDAIKAHLCGGNIATMGKAIGPGQVATIRDPRRLRRGSNIELMFTPSPIKRIYLALDPDAGAETARLIREFSDREVYLMTPPPPHKDLGEMSFEAVYDLFKSAKRVGAGTVIWGFR